MAADFLGAAVSRARALRLLIGGVAVAAILVCSTAIGAAEPGGSPTVPPPVVTAPLTTTPVPSSQAPLPARPADPVPPSDPSGGSTAGESDCGVTNISGCVATAIDGFFQRLVDSALNPLLRLLSQTLLTTPEPGDLPQIDGLWQSSWQLVLAAYGLVVVAAGVLLMAYETLQTRWGWRELVPRLVVGFVAGAMSMVIATQAIRLANGLAAALAGGGVDSDSAAAALRGLMSTGGGTASGLFVILLRNALVVVLTVLLIAYVVRVTITVVLVVAAPIALMCHALPSTEPIARWWWRAFGACLGIQVVQSLVLVTALRVFLTPGGWGFFGPNQGGLMSLLVALALMGVLIKIPFWLLSALRINPGGTLAGSLVRSYVIGKGLGLLTGGHTPARPQTAPPRPPARPKSGPPPDPYARVRATANGQLMLPLKGVHRVKPAAAPPARIPPAWSVPVPAPQGEQLKLPLPQWHSVDLGPKPRQGRDGQYQLPITVPRARKAPLPREPATAPVSAPRRAGKQLAFDFAAAPPDPYATVRPLRGGQYPLPFEVRRVPAPRTAAPLPPAAALARSSGRQLHLPLPNLPIRRRTRRTPGGGSR